MQTKEQMRDELRALNAVPPPDATSDELFVLLKRVRALKKQEPVKVPAPRPRPTFTPQPVTVSPPPSSSAALTSMRLPISDHHRRPHDPMAGW